MCVHNFFSFCLFHLELILIIYGDGDDDDEDDDDKITTGKLVYILYTSESKHIYIT